MQPKQKVIILGAGPAGLTAAFELLKHEGYIPVIIEKEIQAGGLSRTINYKGNLIDIGGHRFFSKSEKVMSWWTDIFPISENPAMIVNTESDKLEDRNKHIENRVMLVRNRISRIFYLKQLFDYPLQLTKDTLSRLGYLRTASIGLSYGISKILPARKEHSLEDFMINRFGKKLYKEFFQSYTEKVWGIACNKIKPEWGAQRIKSLSLSTTVAHYIKSLFYKDASIAQKNTDTSLIERFLYPKFGPGQMWEYVAAQIQAQGGEIIYQAEVKNIVHTNGKIQNITYTHHGKTSAIAGDYFISTIPVKDLIKGMDHVPQMVSEIAGRLAYRDFITMGLLLKKITINNEKFPKDTWIYIQEENVKLGRLQIFNNWSPYMTARQDTVWVGLEYFCNEGDELWSMDEEMFKVFAAKEMMMLGFITPEDMLDATVIKIQKAYPVYSGVYENFDTVKEFINTIENLFVIGRNGMHRYNNQDHSMLTAMETVDNIINHVTDKTNIWNVNTEDSYHETKSSSDMS